MAINKRAVIRYHALDRCFSNPGRKYYIDDLVEACNQAIYEATGSDEGIKRRQVYSDITFMESEAGWSIPLNRVPDGRRKYYRYDDLSFSIRGSGVNQAELEQIADTLVILSRFRGLPHFAWIDQIKLRLEETFGLKQSSAPAVVSFEENPYLEGLSFFSDVFQAATEQKPLEVSYQSFNQEAAETFTFHPWHLKQYNNRWFVLGHNDKYGGLSTLALDRVQDLIRGDSEFVPNTAIDFDEYFEDLIGVSRPDDARVEKVLLRIATSLWPYIRSKPLHGSQRKRAQDEKGVTVELSVIINYELVSLLASYLERVEVLQPASLRERLIDRLEQTRKQY